MNYKDYKCGYTWITDNYSNNMTNEELFKSKFKVVRTTKRRKTMNTISILTKAVTDGQLTKEKAVAIATKRMKTPYAFSKDRGRLLNVRIMAQDQVTQEYYESNENFINFQISRNNQNMGHKDNVAKVAFYCEQNGHWYKKGVYTPINVEGKTVCKECCEGYVWLWTNGEYHFKSEFQEKIMNYHGIQRPESWKTAKGYGIELEIYVPEPKKILNGLSREIFAEKDGSLDEVHGVELVGAPYSYEEYRNNKTPWTALTEKALAIDAKGHSAGDNYGMHVSVSKRLFTVLEAAKFVVFMNMQDELCKLVGQREVVFRGGYKNHQKVGGVLNNWREFKTTKYEPAMVGEGRIEVRIFRANLKYSRILKNIEFCESVRMYTKQASVAVVGSAAGTREYLEWLNKQNGYAELKKFLMENVSKYKNRVDGLEKFVYNKKEDPKKVKDVENV